MPSDDSESCDDDSSIDGDNENEDQLYALIQQDSKQAAQMKEKKQKGEHLNELVDEEMISLLRTCKSLHCPPIQYIQEKCVEFGENPEKKRTLLLDMDETMLHARFLNGSEDDPNSDHIFTL